MPKTRVIVVSDFNADLLKNYLMLEDGRVSLEVECAPFGSVMPTLLNFISQPELNGESLIVWVRPQSISREFNNLLNGEVVDKVIINQEIDLFIGTLVELSGRFKSLVVIGFDIGMWWRQGLLVWHNDIGVEALLAQFNARLSKELQTKPHVCVLDCHRWLMLSGGAQGYSPKLWYMSKMPYAQRVYKEASQDIQAFYLTLQGRARKLIIVDLDDTLWPGVVAELGWQQLALGGHDPVAEALLDFQAYLKVLTKRGIILGIVSKNDEKIALEAIDNHPNMILRRQDFAAWRINWQDKAANIIDLVKELNLGMDAVVFLDDNPFERARVREALTDVLVPEMPTDKMLYPSLLRNLDCFDTLGLTQEDINRATMYQQERERQVLQTSITSPEDWLKSLAITVTVDNFNEVNATRVTQLFNKTNQMNLSTRRLTEQELKEWCAKPDQYLWAFDVSDKFGSSGLTGIVTLQVKGEEGFIMDFILSCRVFGRHIEEVMLHIVSSFAKDKALTQLNAMYLPTSKNKPCLDFFERSGFIQEQFKFIWSLDKVYPKAEYITIQHHVK